MTACQEILTREDGLEGGGQTGRPPPKNKNGGFLFLLLIPSSSHYRIAGTTACPRVYTFPSHTAFEKGYEPWLKQNHLV